MYEIRVSVNNGAEIDVMSFHDFRVADMCYNNIWTFFDWILVKDEDTIDSVEFINIVTGEVIREK